MWEIELRAPLTVEKFQQVERELWSQSRPIVEYRCFVDFTTIAFGISQREIDVRIRVTNGSAELVVKRGKFAAQIREEAALAFLEADLDQALAIAAMLGFGQGVLCARRILRGEIEGVEIALQQVICPTSSQGVVDQFVEVEKLTSIQHDDSCVSELRHFLTRWGVEEFTETGWNEYVYEINKKASLIYTYGKTPVDIIRRFGNEIGYIQSCW